MHCRAKNTIVTMHASKTLELSLYYTGPTPSLSKNLCTENALIINTDCTLSSQAVKDRSPLEENEKYHWNIQKGLQMSLVSNACANY